MREEVVQTGSTKVFLLSNPDVLIRPARHKVGGVRVGTGWVVVRKL